MSGPSRREEQDRRSGQPVKRFSLKGLFNKLTGCLKLKTLFNAFARKRGPKPKPIKIDPTWFTTAEAKPDPTRPPEWDEYVFDEYAYGEDNPGWDEEPPEPVDDTVTVRPGECVPLEAGELLRSYYAPGIGDVRVFARLDPNEMDIDPGLVLGPDDIETDEPAPEKKPKSPK